MPERQKTDEVGSFEGSSRSPNPIWTLPLLCQLFETLVGTKRPRSLSSVALEPQREVRQVSKPKIESNTFDELTVLKALFGSSQSQRIHPSLGTMTKLAFHDPL
jgi:hypothetical protein